MTAPEQVVRTSTNEALDLNKDSAGPDPGTPAATAASIAADVAGSARQGAGTVVSASLDQAKSLAAEVKAQAERQLDDGSRKLTATLRGLSEQLSTGDTSGVIGQLLSEAGTHVQRLSDHVDQAGPRGLVSELREYARGNSGTFLLGLAAVGFASGRLVKAMSADKVGPAVREGSVGGEAQDSDHRWDSGPAAVGVDAPYPGDIGFPATEPTPLTTGYLQETELPVPASMDTHPREAS